VTQAEHQRSFLPQTVPAFAATENFAQLRGAIRTTHTKSGTEPDQSADRAVDWEADVINEFRGHQADRANGGRADTLPAFAFPGAAHTGQTACLSATASRTRRRPR